MTNLEIACEELKDIVTEISTYSISVFVKDNNRSILIINDLSKRIQVDTNINDSVDNIKNSILKEVKKEIKKEENELKELKVRLDKVKFKLILGDYD